MGCPVGNWILKKFRPEPNLSTPPNHNHHYRNDLDALRAKRVEHQTSHTNSSFQSVYRRSLRIVGSHGGGDGAIEEVDERKCVIVWLSHSTVHIRAVRWRRESATRDSPPLYEAGQTITTTNINVDPRTSRKHITPEEEFVEDREGWRAKPLWTTCQG
ncbi:hypothetical protein Aduo_013833 [Ancylostoma duodenale]